jgi:phosphatidylserine/phosphatidylglycerophosphate/cardiolipin synthase-like enzyme
VAAKIAGAAVGPLLASELDIARFSGWAGNLDPPGLSPTVEAVSAQNELTSGHSARVRVLTEGAIRRALLEELDATSRGDSIDIAMLYLADRGVIESLLAAARRGVNVRLILDPNGEAFGQTKTGIPNQPAATELASASDGAVHVRWYRTHGEQFHSKLVMVYGPQRLWMTLGSASLTRRNLGDYNLEANVAIEVSRSSPLALQTLDYFETLWTNRASLGIEYTTDFAAHSDPAQSHYWLYRVMEGTGASTF